MFTADFNPYAQWRRNALRNRIAALRRHPGETAFHALAGLALAAIFLWAAVVGLGAMAGELGDALRRWPFAVGLALLVLCSLAQVRGLRRQASLRARDWLACQPLAPVLQARERLRQVMLEALRQLAIGLGLLACISALRDHLIVLLGILLLAGLIGLCAPQRAAVLSAIGVRGRHPQGAGIGTLPRWQWIEAGAARFGPALAPGAFALLLVPMGSGLALTVFCLLVGLICAALASAWRRSLGVIVSAQAWLAPQPLPGLRLLRDSARLPLLLLLIAMGLLLAAGLALLLPPPVALLASLSLGALGVLHLLCTVVERRRPRRIALLFTLQLALLLLLARGLPPALPLLWLAQSAWLLRRIARE